MDPLSGAASAIAVIQIAAQVGALCGEYLSDVSRARHDIERLQNKVSAIRDVLDQLRKASDGSSSKPLQLSEDTRRAIQQCQFDLNKLRDQLEPKRTRKAMSRFGLRALKWPFSSKQVDKEITTLEGYLTAFNISLQLQHMCVLFFCVGVLPVDQFYSTISSAMEDKLDDAEKDRLIAKLAHVPGAAHDSYENQRHRQCLPETRVEILQEILNWVDSTTTDQSIFWLNGMAGTGKSTIALTVAATLRDQDKVVASFFFKRGGGDLAHGRKLITTIAYQMSLRSQSLWLYVNEAIKKEPSLGQSASLQEQYDKLIIEPLRKLRMSSAPARCFVLIIDALDECEEQKDISLFLRLLGSVKNMPELGLRVFVTCRPQMPIQLSFRNSLTIRYEELKLHNVHRSVVDNDIEIFLRHELERIRRDRDLPSGWPKASQLQDLVEKAAGLFIFAATACRYIDGPPQILPSQRLHQICSHTRTKHRSTKELDEMYLLILESSMSEDFTEEEAEQVTIHFRHIVGSIVLLFDDLSTVELGHLLFPDQEESRMLVEATIKPLQAVLDVPEDLHEAVRILHLSFRDFLLDPERCTNHQLSVKEVDSHEALFADCLNLMSVNLQTNICQLPGPGTLISDVDEDQVAQSLSPAVQYACRYWVDHLCYARMNAADDGLLHQFLKQHYLHWLEAMSLIGKVAEAVRMVTRLEKEINVSSWLCFNKKKC
jgi:hypothetical protein